MRPLLPNWGVQLVATPAVWSRPKMTAGRGRGLCRRRRCRRQGPRSRSAASRQKFELMLVAAPAAAAVFILLSPLQRQMGGGGGAGRRAGGQKRDPAEAGPVADDHLLQTPHLGIFLPVGP
jgi:hypothetical protein